MKYTIILALATQILSSCYVDLNIIRVKNNLDQDRKYETVEIYRDNITLDIENISIKDSETDKILVTQLVDEDGDSKFDKLLFQVDIKSKSEKKYYIVDKVEQKDIVNYCYSRFVPERTDDYTWENNRVAFRVYGPTAQKMIEENIPGGTLSSGVDAWLKRVEYPIINKWYKEYVDQTGSYHVDTGEGLDNFHVGVSRGVGGIAIESNGKYFTSKNYKNWKTITNGPIRTSFSLDYETWDADGKLIKESKIISLDYGSNLSKFETTIEGSENISAGLTIHEKDGQFTKHEAKGWINYYQPHADSEISTSIVSSPGKLISTELYDVDEKDLSNAYAQLKVENNKVVYYAGFYWEKSKQFKSNKDWEEYLSNFYSRLQSPLIVEFY